MFVLWIYTPRILKSGFFEKKNAKIILLEMKVEKRRGIIVTEKNPV
jgi:hypothetical protein